MQRKCNNTCKCKSCSQEFGVKPPVSAKRKRRSYEEKVRQPLRGRPTEDFMSSKFEVINKGKITLLENLILKGIVMYLFLHGLPITPQLVLKIFQIMHFVQCKHVEFPIFEHSGRFIIHILELFNP